ncbi:Ureidoglycolate hydrolase (AtUAH) (Allantoate amidohydrolase 2) (AtAHH2) (Ureidoglycolate amidohydrolase) [Durusdinium trenchii]|uniref:Ureidoglycolate hydrolase (AtUAH) (Allantoate amidohydrolase 2) (AtAHH2) (Ureidoglycolate amidohydrolase) n=1 Tax=Durusdinium trenchii TaxID=1381693 RepID=A0ABP0LE23_9DINO
MDPRATILARNVLSRCDELGGCTSEPGRITRLFLDEPMRGVHVRLTEWMHQARLSPHVDNAGNCIGRLRSRDGDKVLLIGSHLDSVPGAGRYDGVLGVMLGVAVSEWLADHELPFHLDVIGFSEEEGVRYKMPYLGSAAVAGRFDPKWLSREDEHRITMREAMTSFGLSPDDLESCKYDPRQVIGYLEPHLEQGPVLERLNQPLGVVTGIVGQTRLLLAFIGQAGHAGTAPMVGRRDALVAAATFIQQVRKTAHEMDGLKATVGSMRVYPNTPNVIPGGVQLTLDVRHLADDVRQHGIETLMSAGYKIAESEGCAFEVLEETSQHSVNADTRMMSMLSDTVKECCAGPVLLESGAGHDAAIMGQHFPMAMLFLRHPGGVSHHPDERVELDDVAMAIEVLGQYVLRLADQFKHDESGVVLISPAMGHGASAPRFVQYLAHGGENSSTSGAADNIQRLVYLLEGTADLEGEQLAADSFAWFPPNDRYTLKLENGARALVFEKVYEPLPGYIPPGRITGTLAAAEKAPFLGDPDAMLATLLPTEPAFDMAINVFDYKSGTTLPFVETHVMEHGLYMRSGQGVYRLGERWYPVQQGDTIWMASYCPQWFVAMGKENASYIYYKDIHRPELEQLATHSDCSEPPPAVTRVVFTETDLRAREYLAGLYDAAGLTVRVDAIGNTFARFEGSEPDLPAVGTGSHTDAIPHAGMYDGTVGVLGGLEAVRALQRAGFKPRRSIDVVMFTSEEPTRFGVGCTGSRLMSGAMPIEQLASLRDESGGSYDEVRSQAGFSGELSSAVLDSDAYNAFVELHIEQGPLLEQADESIGVVKAIAAPATVHFEVTGEGGHAGAVLMPARRDALAAAAGMVLAIERLALDSRSPDLVATVGELDVHPGAVNSIPSRVRFTLDLRDIDGENRDEVLESIIAACTQIAAGRRVELSHQVVNADPPAVCDERIVAAATSAAKELQLAHRQMISRAYHDSLFMARIAPTGMIFIPCRGGVSHRPDEYTSPEHLEAGVATLALTLAQLAS